MALSSIDRRGSILLAAAALWLGACAHHPASPPAPRNLAAIPSKKDRLAAVMWPNDHSIIYCTRRIDDWAKPVGVAGPCYRLEVGETAPIKILSWATLGRFDGAPPDAVPGSLGGRCHLEIEQGQRSPALSPARLTWVTPTHRQELDDWLPTDDPAAIEADGFTVEASFAPEGKWLAILHVAVGLGEGERVVQVAGARLVPVPACD